MSSTEQASIATDAAVKQAREALDAHTYETVQWHFHESTGCPFWLEYASKLKFDPLKDIRTFDDLKKFEPFQDEWQPAPSHLALRGEAVPGPPDWKR